MSKIADLHSFILGLNLFAAEQMDSFVDDLTISPSGRPGPEAGQVIVAEKDYTATFFIERYPHGQVSGDALMAQISAWLLENDLDRTNSKQFPLIVELLDSKTANLEFGIAFNELIIAAENVAGTITIDGKKYALI